MQKYDISLRGGSEKLKFFGLIGHMNQETLWKKDGGNYKRFNVRGNIDAEVAKNLTMAMDFSNINEIRKFPNEDADGDDRNLWRRLWNNQPIYPVSLPDPNRLSYAGDADQGNILATSDRNLSGFGDNIRQNIRLNTSLQYDFPFLSGLSAKYFISYNQGYSDYKSMNKPVEFYTYDYDSDIYTLASSAPQVTLNHLETKSRNITSQASLSYNQTYNEDHEISALFLHELVDEHYEWITASRRDFLTQNIEYLFGGSVDQQFANGSAAEMGRMSYINRLNYAYKGKYLFEGILRADGSARFPKESRWGYFPSVSLGWRMSEEDFVKENLMWVDNLKLRVSVGQAGYDAVANFAYLSGYNFNRLYIYGDKIMNGLFSKGLPNPNLTWEEMTTYNIGLDFSVLNSQLYGEGDVFYRTREGIPGTRLRSLPSTFGANLPVENINSTNDRGFELQLGTRNRINDFSYDFSANVSWSRAKWDHFEEPEYEDPDEVRVYQSSGNWVDRVVGYLTDGVYTSQEEIDAMTFDQDGMGNSTIRPGDIRYIDLNDDGILDWKDRTEIGAGILPHWMFGASMNLSYKNFNVNVLFQGAAGNHVNVTVPTNSTVYYENRWSEENNNRDALFHRNGSIAEGGGFSDFYLKKAGYLRMKNLNVGYQLPDQFVRDLNIQMVRIFFAGTNLFTFDRLSKYNLDPEVKQSGGGYDQAGYFYYPQQQTYSLGLTITI